MGLKFIVKQTPMPSLKVFSSDGYIGPLSGEPLWAGARNTPSNLIAVTTPEAGYNALTARVFDGNYSVYRAFLYFDLSSLPGSATVVSAVVSSLRL